MTVSSGRAIPQAFMGNSGHMAEPSQPRSLYSEKWFIIQGFAIFTSSHFLAKRHTVNSQKSYLVIE